ncbi:acyltransferase [Hymenobacter nivis]|uniref:Acyltransferase n=2 Tax=Hymenobacter nivis TaxID=1850093 RepID=A0A502GCC9_9BACT|nr:acyltransferase [Hymenobacter nivis]
MEIKNCIHARFSHETHSNQIINLEQKKSVAHRNSLLDLIKVAASIGVISAHVHSDTAAAESLSHFFSPVRVPFLYITALAFFISNIHKKSSADNDAGIQDTLVKIGKRIVLPFLVWSAVYVLLITLKSLITGVANPHAFDLGKVLLYGDSAEHLYFLPQLLVMELIGLGIYLLADKNNQNKGLIVLSVAAIYLIWGYEHKYYGMTPLPSLIAYTVMAFYLGSKIKKRQTHWGYAVLGAALLVLAISASFVSYPKIFAQYFLALPIGGFGLLLLTLNIPRLELPSWLITLSSVSYGVYLGHVMVLEGLEFVIAKAHISMRYDLATKALVTLVVFLISTILVLVLRKIPVLKELFLGESTPKASVATVTYRIPEYRRVAA